MAMLAALHDRQNGPVHRDAAAVSFLGKPYADTCREGHSCDVRARQGTGASPQERPAGLPSSAAARGAGSFVMQVSMPRTFDRVVRIELARGSLSEVLVICTLLRRSQQYACCVCVGTVRFKPTKTMMTSIELK